MNVVSLITCTATGKSYVGVTTTGEKVPKPDFDPLHYGHGTLFTEIVKQYGRKAFTIKVLKCYPTANEMYDAEVRFIKKLNTLYPSGYNLHTGGVGGEPGPIGIGIGFNITDGTLTIKESVGTSTGDGRSLDEGEDCREFSDLWNKEQWNFDEACARARQFSGSEPRAVKAKSVEFLMYKCRNGTSICVRRKGKDGAHVWGKSWSV
jgi:hypothetical protein